MKRMLLKLVTLSAILAMVSIPVLAGPPTAAEGLWLYLPTVVSERWADGNRFVQTTEVGEWSGTFDGVSTEVGQVVRHSSGFRSFTAIVSFEGEVDGKEGTLEMSVAGKRPDAFSDWQGRWVILSGTDELTNLRGQGIWWGPGAPAPEEWGDIYYSGTIHFEPE